jgi:hypothetical protein
MLLLATAALALALTWAYVLAAPMAFLESGYAVWSAKQALLRGCDLGDLAIFGDSQPEAAIMPERLSEKAANISFGAASPVEMSGFVGRALHCPAPPSRVVLALEPMNFQDVSEFLWRNDARFGFIGFAELEAIRHTADRLGDPAFEQANTGDGLRGLPRDLLYALHFPPLYFSALVQARGFGRYRINQARFAAVRRSRGFVPYASPQADDLVAEVAALDRFAPIALQDYYLGRMLELLRDRGVAVELLTLPITEATGQRLKPEIRAQFAAYLAGFAARYANVHVLGPVLPVWPDRLFSDRNHLNPEGAAAYSARFDACLRQPRACDLSAPKPRW